MDLQIDLRYEIDSYGADFVFNIHAAQTPHQIVHNERLVLSQDIPHQIHTDPATGNRYLRLHGEPGMLELTYSATVEYATTVPTPPDWPRCLCGTCRRM